MFDNLKHLGARVLLRHNYGCVTVRDVVGQYVRLFLLRGTRMPPIENLQNMREK